jgi:hypothetical protein
MGSYLISIEGLPHRMSASHFDPTDGSRSGAEINARVSSDRGAGDSYEALYGADAKKHAPVRRRARLAKPGFGTLAIVTLLVGMAAVAKRETLVRAAPASAPAFAAMGLPVNARGLEFRRVSSKLIEDGDQRVLTIEGEVASLRAARGKLPDLQVSVRTADGRPVYAWTSPAPAKEIGAGEVVYFRARLAAPPPEGREVKVQFAALAGK